MSTPSELLQLVAGDAAAAGPALAGLAEAALRKRAFLDRLDPEARKALLWGLVGAGGLGTIGAARALLDKNRRGRALPNFLTGALVGGLGGAGAGYLHEKFLGGPSPQAQVEELARELRATDPAAYEREVASGNVPTSTRHALSPPVKPSVIDDVGEFIRTLPEQSAGGAWSALTGGYGPFVQGAGIGALAQSAARNYRMRPSWNQLYSAAQGGQLAEAFKGMAEADVNAVRRAILQGGPQAVGPQAGRLQRAMVGPWPLGPFTAGRTAAINVPDTEGLDAVVKFLGEARTGRGGAPTAHSRLANALGRVYEGHLPPLTPPVGTVPPRPTLDMPLFLNMDARARGRVQALLERLGRESAPLGVIGSLTPAQAEARATMGRIYRAALRGDIAPELREALRGPGRRTIEVTGDRLREAARLARERSTEPMTGFFGAPRLGQSRPWARGLGAGLAGGVIAQGFSDWAHSQTTPAAAPAAAVTPARTQQLIDRLRALRGEAP
jgi:hypothetical protein